MSSGWPVGSMPARKPLTKGASIEREDDLIEVPRECFEDPDWE